MSRIPDTLQILRDRQLSWGLRALAFMGFVSLVASLLRAFTIGWHPIMAFHIILYVIVLLTAVLNRRLSFSVRAIIAISIPLTLGITGLLVWGFGGAGLQALFSFSILSTVFFGERIGKAASALSIIIIVVIGFLVCSGTIHLRYDPTVMLTSYVAWFGAVLSMVISGGIVVAALGALNQEVENLVYALEGKNREMEKIIQKLELEIYERARIEKERSELENQLERAKKMETLGTLAGGVAHDLNNMLVGIVSYPDLLLSRIKGDDPLRKPLETMKRSGSRAAAIVQDLLSLARRGAMSMSPVNLNDIISDYIISHEHQMMLTYHPGVIIELELEENLAMMSGSPVHLFKIIMNLVSNAVESMQQGGKVTATTKSVCVQERVLFSDRIKAGNYIMLSISDTGSGIPGEEIENIFEPFYTKKNMGRSGTGLGMAVVWGAVKDHNGYIDVTSVVGEGTTFTLYFPILSEMAIADKIDIQIKDETGRGESILIVDDIEEQREITAAMLYQLGYAVNTAASGEEALEKLAEIPTDLLFLDMYMDPGMDGLETYRKAIKIKPRQKAVIASGYAETERVKEAQRLGAGPFIRKPFFLKDIGMIVRRELDRQ